MTKRFVVLSGPSCVGKGSLQAALVKLYPSIKFVRPILCTSRQPRVSRGEIHGRDFYFLPPSLIESLTQDPRSAVEKVRADWQAIDLAQVDEMCETDDLVLAEVFHTFGSSIRRRLETLTSEFVFSSVFLLPVAPDAHPAEIIEVMQGKLSRRGTEDVAAQCRRAREAPSEIQSASAFSHLILNPAGEDDVEQ